MRNSNDTALRNLTRDELAIMQLFVHVSRQNRTGEQKWELPAQFRIELGIAERSEGTDISPRKFAITGLSSEEVENGRLLLRTCRADPNEQKSIKEFLKARKREHTAVLSCAETPPPRSVLSQERPPLRAPLRR